MNQSSKRILTSLLILLPCIIAVILTKSILFDILPIIVIAIFSFLVAVNAKRTSRVKYESN